MTREKRLLITGSVVLVVVFLLSLAFCGRSKKQPPPSADPLAKISELNRVEAETHRLGSRVSVLESKPAPKAKVGGGATQQMVKSLVSKIDQLTDRVDGQGRRLDTIEARLNTPPPPPTGPRPLGGEEKENSAEELAHRLEVYAESDNP